MHLVCTLLISGLFADFILFPHVCLWTRMLWTPELFRLNPFKWVLFSFSGKPRQTPPNVLQPLNLEGPRMGCFGKSLPWPSTTPRPTQNPETPENAAFTRTFSRSSREVLPSSLWRESGIHKKIVQRNLFGWTSCFRWILGGDCFLSRFFRTLQNKAVLGQASARNRFWRDFLEVSGPKPLLRSLLRKDSILKFPHQGNF